MDNIPAWASSLLDNGVLGLIVLAVAWFLYARVWPQLVKWQDEKTATDERRWQEFRDTLNAQRTAHLSSQQSEREEFLKALRDRDMQMSEMVTKITARLEQMADQIEQHGEILGRMVRNGQLP